LGAFAKLLKANFSFVVSIRPSVRLSAWRDAAPIERVFMNYDIFMIFQRSVDKI